MAQIWIQLTWITGGVSTLQRLQIELMDKVMGAI